MPSDTIKTRNIRLHFKYPSVASVKMLTPKERVDHIARKFRSNLATLKKAIGPQKFKLIGTNRKPRGIEIRYTRRAFRAIQKLDFIQPVLPTNKKSNGLRDEPYFCFKLIFEIQIEGKKGGMQTIEERFVLAKAKTWNAAESKVVTEFKKNDEPYLNHRGQLVRWKFKSIEESYHTFIESDNDFNSPVEVFSKLRTRRMKDVDMWNGKA